MGKSPGRSSPSKTSSRPAPPQRLHAKPMAAARAAQTTKVSAPKAATKTKRAEVAIPVPTRPALTDGSSQMAKGHASGAVTMAAKRAAIAEGIAKAKRPAPQKR
jgi:hypothetical protein